MSLPNFVAISTSSRRPFARRAAPRNSSDVPAGVPYVSAVSNSVMPQSSAASTTACAWAWSMRRPKLLQPRPTTETARPESPSRRYRICMVLTLPLPAFHAVDPALLVVDLRRRVVIKDQLTTLRPRSTGESELARGGWRGGAEGEGRDVFVGEPADRVDDRLADDGAD